MLIEIKHSYCPGSIAAGVDEKVSNSQKKGSVTDETIHRNLIGTYVKTQRVLSSDPLYAVDIYQYTFIICIASSVMTTDQVTCITDLNQHNHSSIKHLD